MSKNWKKNTGCNRVLIMENIVKEKILLIGVGGAGVKFASYAKKLDSRNVIDYLIIDTDRQSLEDSCIDNKLPLGFDNTEGYGCGGDSRKGINAFGYMVRKKIIENLKDSTSFIVVGGLGGGTTAGLSILAGIIKNKLKRPGIFLCTTPFSFEGAVADKNATKVANDLQASADVLITISNNLMSASIPPETGNLESFEKVNIEIARAALGLSEILRCEKLITNNFAHFKRVFNKKKNDSAIAIGHINKSDNKETRANSIIDKMLDSPLLGGRKQIFNADIILISLTADKNFPISEMKFILDSVSELFKGKNIELIVGVNNDDLYDDEVQLTVITTRLVKDQVKQNSTILPRYAKNKAKQPELPLVSISRGKFTKTEPFTVDGVDMDIPTVVRKHIIVDKGER